MSEYRAGDRVRIVDDPALRRIGLATRIGTVVSAGDVTVRVDVDGKTGTRTLFYDEVEKVSQ